MPLAIRGSAGPPRLGENTGRPALWHPPRHAFAAAARIADVTTAKSSSVLTYGGIA